jgi:hypothetical protein
MHFIHASPVAGHLGCDKAMYRATKDFYLPGMKADIKKIHLRV